MGQYKVPQDVQREDRIFGPFTLKQFLFLIGGAMIGYMTYSIFSKLGAGSFSLLMGLLFFAPIASFSVVKIQGMELSDYLTALIIYLAKPRKRVWAKDISLPDISYTPKKEETEVQNINPQEVKSRLEQLAQVLDSRGWNGQIPEPSISEQIEQPLESEMNTEQVPANLNQEITYDQTNIKEQVNSQEIKINDIDQQKIETVVQESNKAQTTETKATSNTPTTEKPLKIEPSTQTEKITPPELSTVQIKKDLTPTISSSQKTIIRPALDQKIIEEKTRKIEEEYAKVEAKLRAEIEKKIKLEIKEQEKVQKENLKTFKQTVEDLEKQIKAPLKTKKRKKTRIKPVEPVIFKTLEESKIDLKSHNYLNKTAQEERIMTPWSEKPSVNIMVDESNLDDVLAFSDEGSELKKEIEEFNQAVKTQTKKSKPKIIKTGQNFY